MESWQSGLLRRFAKPVAERPEGSNPSLSDGFITLLNGRFLNEYCKIRCKISGIWNGDRNI